MIPWALVLAVILIAVVGSSVMVGLISHVSNRLRALEGRGLPGPGSTLDENARLREDLEILTDEVSRLTERLDFTEKLLQPPDAPASDGEVS